MNREMKHSGIAWIGEIPKQWTVELLGNNVKLVDNPNSDCSEDNALQFKMGTIISKKHGDSKYNPLTLEAYNKVQEGDIVLNGLNLSFDFISQRVGLVKEKGVITSAYLTIRPTKTLDSIYLTYLLKAYDCCKAFHGMGRGLRQTLSYKELRYEKLIYPSFAEQKAIADFLDKKCEEIDELVALQEKIIEELKSYKQSVITETVCKGLNPNAPMKDSGVEWIGEIPEGWEVSRFKNIASVKANLVSPEQYPDLPQVAPDNIEKDAGILLNYKKVKDANIISDNHLFYKGQIVYSKIRPTLNKAIIAPFDGLCSADMYPIETTQHTKYMLYFILSGIFTKQVQRIVNDRVKMPKINKEEISTILAIIPPIPEQREIADYLDKKCSEIDQLISIKQQKIVELKEYKKSLIYEYTTGKKEV